MPISCQSDYFTINRWVGSVLFYCLPIFYGGYFLKQRKIDFDCKVFKTGNTEFFQVMKWIFMCF